MGIDGGARILSRGGQHRAFPFLAALVLLCLSVDSLAAVVHSVRLWRAADHTRPVFALCAGSGHSLFALAKPDRPGVDITAIHLAADLDSPVLKGTPISRLRPR